MSIGARNEDLVMREINTAIATVALISFTLTLAFLLNHLNKREGITNADRMALTELIQTMENINR